MIVVTGATGVLGRALLDIIRDAGEPVQVVSSAHVDLRVTDQVDELFARLKPRIVYHLAAKVHGLGGNQQFPAEMFTDNIRINTNVIDAARRSGCEKFVAASTVAIYSPDAPKPVSEDSIWNGPPHGAEAYYGHAKRAMLAQLEAVQRQYGLSFAYSIMTNIYGRNDRYDPEFGHVIPSLIAKFHDAVSSGTGIEVWGRGIAERDFIHATDAARALTLIAASHEGSINIATGHIVPIREIVNILAQHCGVTDIRWDTSKPDGELIRRYDVSRLKALDFVPTISLPDGLRDTYDWYAAAYPGVRR